MEIRRYRNGSHQVRVNARRPFRHARRIQKLANSAAIHYSLLLVPCPDDTATVYYNYRHYEPVTGRWMQRDDVDELTLYLQCANSSIGSFDLLGNRSYSYEFNFEQNPSGVSFYGRVSVSESDCPNEIEVELLMGVEWQPPQLRAANRVLNLFRIYIEGGVRGLIGGKAKVSECSGKSTSKICGRLEAFARAEYRDWKV